MDRRLTPVPPGLALGLEADGLDGCLRHEVPSLRWRSRICAMHT